MFPRLRQQILARVDLVVEFSTLGEYGVDECGGVMQLDAEPATVRRSARLRDHCGEVAPDRPCPAAQANRPFTAQRG